MKAWFLDFIDQLLQPAILFIIALLVIMWLLGNHLKRVVEKHENKDPD